MGKRPTYLFTFSLLLLVAIVSYRYEQYVVKGNYLIDVNAVCDPSKEQCFVSDCSPEDDLACDTAPYKKVEIKEYDAPSCLEEHSCDSFSCAGKPSCTITYCDADNLEDGETCASAT